MEIGDVFVIGNPFEGRNRKSKSGGFYYYKCKTPDKRFIIKRFSGSKLTIYYDDKRTNNGCRCNHCNSKPLIDFEKSVNSNSIVIVESKLERLRDLKLKLLLGKL